MKPRPWDQSDPSNWFLDSPEIRINQLTERINALEAIIRQRFGDDALSIQLEQEVNPPSKKRGPAPTVSKEHRYYRREAIIDLLEFYWPEFRVPFRQKNQNAIRRLLAEYSRPDNGSYASTAKVLFENIDQLMEFLNCKEWNGDPRLAASAMAGVPDIRWTTSLRKCRGIPTDRAIGVRALRDYLHRNFPDIFLALLRTKTPEKVREVMSKIRTKDREYNWLRDNPECVADVLRRGLPAQDR